MGVVSMTKHDRMRLATRAFKSLTRIELFLRGRHVSPLTRLAIIHAAQELGLDIGELGRPLSTSAQRAVGRTTKVRG
jgi:hypothetical protein